MEKEWDREEVVILVAEYFRTKSWDKDRLEENYQRISHFLRMREEIITKRMCSLKFRNLAGITMQTARIRSLDPETPQFGMQGTALQQVVVKEYLDNPQKIIAEAAAIEKKYNDLEKKRHEHKLTISDRTIQRIKQFTEDRDWDQFHTPVNLAKSISIEASELLECFQWSDTEFNREHVCEELADVMNYCIQMADKLDVDLDQIINDKIDQNEKKYPVEAAKGSAAKYTELKK